MNTPASGNQRIFRARDDVRRALLAAAACALLGLAAGCGQPASDSPAPAARPTEATQSVFGDLEVHYNAIRTDHLTPEIARAYGIERSPNRVLLNVAMLARAADGRTAPVDGVVSAAAHNLVGQLKSLEMRRVQEGPAVYFIGDVGISGTEILVFNIEVEPATGGGRHSMQFKREFFAD
jgi:hypothetical protein